MQMIICTPVLINWTLCDFATRPQLACAFEFGVGFVTKSTQPYVLFISVASFKIGGLLLKHKDAILKASVRVNYS